MDRYSPILVHASEMMSCFKKFLGFSRDYEWVLIQDPTLLCSENYELTNLGFSRGMLLFHVFSVAVGIGIGLPFYVVSKTNELRRKNNLSADNDLAVLYEYYSPRVPAFEAVVLIRKLALLTISISAWVKNSVIQSIVALVINSIYSILFFAVKPMVYHPTAAIKDKNLFDMTEIAASVATITGNIIALLIAIEQEEIEEGGGSIGDNSM